MPFILHLGVVDLPYANADIGPIKDNSKSLWKNRKRKAKKAKPVRFTKSGKPYKQRAKKFRAPKEEVEPKEKKANTTTTGDVATILEDHYHVMEVFVEEAGGAEKLEEVFRHSAEKAMLAILAGGDPQKLSLTEEALSEIGAAFKDFLSLQLMDGIMPGVPTKASLAGVNHRLKHPYAKKNKPRPSFIDTGLYQSSFKAWTD